MTKEQALKQIEELKKYVEGMEGKREFKRGEDAVILLNTGEWLKVNWVGDEDDRMTLSQGNAFHTREEAEAEKMRREAAATRWDFVPNKAEEIWLWSFEWNEPAKTLFNNYKIEAWNIGSVKRTEEECQAWGDRYSRYFNLPN